MMRAKRPVFALVGLGLLAGVVFLGIKAVDDSSLVGWFGLAAAILAPAGFTFLGLSFQADDRRVLRRLSAIPEIDRLAEEAESKQALVAALDAQRRQLAETVRFEAQRIALADRRVRLEDEAERVVADLNALDEELRRLDLAPLSPQARDAVTALEDRLEARRRGEWVVTIGGRTFAVDVGLVPTAFPVGLPVKLLLRRLGGPKTRS